MALSGAHGDHVSFVGWTEESTRGVDAKHVGMEMEGGHGVKLNHIKNIEPNQLVLLNGNRVVHEVMGRPIEGVELVLFVAVGVVARHDQHHLIGGGPRGHWIDDEHAVESLADMSCDGFDMAVVEVDAVGMGVKFVDENVAIAHGFYTVHIGRVMAVEVEGMGVTGFVVEDDADAIALHRPQRRSRHPPIQVPGNKLGGGIKLNRTRLGLNAKLPHGAAILLGDGAVVELAQGLEGEGGFVGDGGDLGRWHWSEGLCRLSGEGKGSGPNACGTE